MGLFLACFSLTVATTLATGAAAALWAQFVGKGMDGRDVADEARRGRFDIKTW